MPGGAMIFACDERGEGGKKKKKGNREERE